IFNSIFLSFDDHLDHFDYLPFPALHLSTTVLRLFELLLSFPSLFLLLECPLVKATQMSFSQTSIQGHVQSSTRTLNNTQGQTFYPLTQSTNKFAFAPSNRIPSPTYST